MSILIKADNIAASYEGKQVLDNVSLTIFDDDYLGIIGPNGGGKTTLIKIILGLKKPDKGNISFYRDGKQVDHLNMGYLPQYTQIDRKFPISVYDVVLSGLKSKKPFLRPYTKEQRLQVDNTLKRMELTEFKQKNIGELSGGQLQRVLLARAIVSKPDIIILDEPNTYIDMRFKEQMYQMLEMANKDCAVVVVSHDIAEILQYTKHIACVNGTMHYHSAESMPKEKLEEHFLKMCINKDREIMS